MIELQRRTFISGLISLIAAPALVRAESLMKIKTAKKFMTLEDYRNDILNPMLLNHGFKVGDIIYFPLPNRFYNKTRLTVDTKIFKIMEITKT